MILDTLIKLNNKKTRKQIALELGISQATISKNINKLTVKNFLSETSKITELGSDELRKTKINNAIILAAGWGSRLYPITKDTPKPLVKVNGKPIIEYTLIQLKKLGIDNIVIVTGKLHEKFDYLQEKYNVKLIYNNKWNIRESIHSIFKAKNHLGNSLIIEGDTMLNESLKIPAHIKDSLYFLCKSNNFTDEWVAKLKGRNVVGIKKGSKTGGLEWKGIYFVNNIDSMWLKEFFKMEYENDPKWWSHDFALFIFSEMKHRYLRSYEINEEDTYESDTIEDLIKVDPSYKNWKDMYK